jgi:limonene-1,2-epoxide hydrolase
VNQALPASLSFIEAMERAVMSRDLEAAGQFLHHDVAYTVGSRATVRGLAAVLRYIDEQEQLARWAGHRLQAAWQLDDVIIVEVISHFVRTADQRRISFPCTDIYRLQDARIADWRVYADMSPFGAPST